MPSVASLYNKYLPKLRDVVADRKFKMNNGDTSEQDITEKTFLFEGTAGEAYEVFDRGTPGKLVHTFDVYNDEEEGEEFVVYISLTEDEENVRRGKVSSAITSIRFSKSFRSKQILIRLTYCYYRTGRVGPRSQNRKLFCVSSLSVLGLILILWIVSANYLRNCFHPTLSLIPFMGTNSKLETRRPEKSFILSVSWRQMRMESLSFPLDQTNRNRRRTMMSCSRLFWE